MVSRTIIEWHSVDELPKESGKYILKMLDGDLMSVKYSSKYKKFNTSDSFSEKDVKKFGLDESYYAAWGTIKEEN